MKYKFRYASRWDKKTLRSKIHKSISDKIFELYDNKYFKLLKLDTDKFISAKVEYDKTSDKTYLKNKLPKENSFNPVAFSFFDIISIEEIEKFKRNLIVLTRLYKHIIRRSSSDIKKKIDAFETRYKGISTGVFYRIHLTKYQNIDLIDGVELRYIKGPLSSFIIEYKITPSPKFIDAYKRFLINDDEEIDLLHFNDILTALKRRNVFAGDSTKPIRSHDYLRRLIQDLNFQVSIYFGKKLDVGYFFQSKNHLYPCISVFQVDENEFSQHSDEYHLALGLEKWNSFKSEKNEAIFNITNIELYNKPFEVLSVIHLNEKNSSDLQKIKRTFSNWHVTAIAPILCCINFSCLSQTMLTDQRKKMFKYFKKNRDSLFLKEATKLKYQITQNWLTISKITKDYNHPFFKRHFATQDLPNAKRQMPQVQEDFKDFLWKLNLDVAKDIVDEYKEINDVFTQISQDNVTRSNMRIQRILIYMTLIAMIIAFYSSNTQYFNSKMKSAFEVIKRTIPID